MARRIAVKPQSTARTIAARRATGRSRRQYAGAPKRIVQARLAARRGK